MFAVPGWSVSADNLAAEKVSATGSQPGGKPRKRKRADGGAPAAVTSVTSSNVAELWESVVEGKTAGSGDDPEKHVKRQKKEPGGKGKGKHVMSEDRAEEGGETQPNSKRDKKKKKKKQGGQNDGDVAKQVEKDAPASKNDAATKPQAPSPLPPNPPKLTPLQASMREKLISSRFRHLNETLYTKPSEEAYQLFQDSPEMFGEYHEGFRRQVKVWPENPVDSFLRDIRSRGKVRAPGKGKPGAAPTPRSRTTLPRTAGACTIADLGCGDARLAESLQADKNKLKIDVKSFDLQSPSVLVTKADIANLPLEDGSVNVAVFCLALMGTNWIDFIEEAYRILHWKGELWVAEIKSRFGPVRSKHAPVDHSVGNRKKPAKKAKGRGAEGDGADDEDLAVEVDGADDRRRETDVSAFIEVLRKRGFVLQGERSEAVDLSNKMFVKMHFTKGASPTSGKGAKLQEPAKGRKAIIRKLDYDEDDGKAGAMEASVLKPCLYKIR